MKEDKYTKILAKNQVYVIVQMRDIRKTVLPKFIKLCMETPCLCPFQGHKYGRRKPTDASVFEFSYLLVNSSLEELIKIKVIFILRQGRYRGYFMVGECGRFFFTSCERRERTSERSERVSSATPRNE